MQKLFSLIVEKNKIVLIIFVLFTLFSLWLIPQVKINTDMSKYLPEDSSTKIGNEIMNTEFPEVTSSSFNLMIEGIKEVEKSEIYDILSKIQNIQSVTYESGSQEYNKDNFTLYIINIATPIDSPETKEVVDTITDKFSSYDFSINGDAVGNTAADILPKLAGFAFIILLVILFIMCKSWIEPLLFLITIAIAILINMGTNAIFGSVSETTNSIAAILQLCLSMDYSIMLINRYRQEKLYESNKNIAMKKALQNAFTAISSSSITTIVGMLALVFMSFTIGKDMGFVLAKGVLLSLVCIFTVLPALILIFDKLIEKTAKKALHIKMNKIASLSYAFRYVIVIIFIILFVGSFFLKGNVGITYTMADYYEINKIFPQNNPIVVLYENEDEAQINLLIEKWEKNSYINSVSSYSTTLGKELTYDEIADATGMEDAFVAQMYYYYFSKKGESSNKVIAFDDFIEFLKNDVVTNEQFAPFFTEDDLAQLYAIGGEGSEQVRLSSEEFSVFSGMDINIIQQIYGYYFNINGQQEDEKIELNDLIEFLITNIATDEQFAQYFTQDTLAQLNAMNTATDSETLRQELSSDELALYLDMDEVMVEQLYNYYAIVHGEMPQERISMYDFVQFIVNDVATSQQFNQYFTAEILEQLEEAETAMNDGYKQLIGDKFSRVVINTHLAEESEETFDFIRSIEKEIDNALNGKHYIIGNSTMAYEMSSSFPNEMNLITILMAIAIFIVVAIAFRSLAIPLILVCIIQCAIFITLGITYIQGSNIYFLPFLIVQCLLLGATVDYGILYTSYYREARNTLDKKEAIIKALNNSIHTILTSASILIVVTGALGIMLMNSDRAISEILLIIAKGGFCATALVVFILPGIISALDRFVVNKRT